jgi:hypothetical protein
MARKATGAIALLIELLWERIGDGCHLSRDIGQLAVGTRERAVR